jgi:hypothetical protein
MLSMLVMRLMIAGAVMRALLAVCVEWLRQRCSIVPPGQTPSNSSSNYPLVLHCCKCTGRLQHGLHVHRELLNTMHPSHLFIHTTTSPSFCLRCTTPQVLPALSGLPTQCAQRLRCAKQLAKPHRTAEPQAETTCMALELSRHCKHTSTC